jgi:hypothetical protein
MGFPLALPRTRKIQNNHANAGCIYIEARSGMTANTKHAGHRKCAVALAALPALGVLLKADRIA